MSPIKAAYLEHHLKRGMRPNERSVSSERLIRLGGEDLGSFGDGVSVAKGPNISHQESFDRESGITTLSFTGIGVVVVDEKSGKKFTDRLIL